MTSCGANFSSCPDLEIEVEARSFRILLNGSFTNFMCLINFVFFGRLQRFQRSAPWIKRYHRISVNAVPFTLPLFHYYFTVLRCSIIFLTETLPLNGTRSWPYTSDRGTGTYFTLLLESARVSLLGRRTFGYNYLRVISNDHNADSRKVSTFRVQAE